MIKALLLLALLTLFGIGSSAQDSTLTLTAGMFNPEQFINLSTRPGWVFKAGLNPAWANPRLNTTNWVKRNPSDLSVKDAGQSGRMEGWFRLRIRLDSTFQTMQVGIYNSCWAAADLYIDGRLVTSFGNTGTKGMPYAEHYPYYQAPFPLDLTIGQDHLMALHMVDQLSPFSKNQLKGEFENGTSNIIQIVGPQTMHRQQAYSRAAPIYFAIWATVSLLLALLFWLLFLQNLYEKTIIRLLAIGETFLLLSSLCIFSDAVSKPGFMYEIVLYRLEYVFLTIAVAFLPLTLRWILKYPSARQVDGLLLGISVIGAGITAYTQNYSVSSVVIVLQFLYFLWLLIRKRKELAGAQWAIVVGTFLSLTFFLCFAIVNLSGASGINPFPIATGYYLALPVSLLVYITLRFKEIVMQDRAKAAAVVQITEEKRQLLTTQNQLLEQQVEIRTAELKASQAQLIQKEKLASLGELTAGIAHEIQNPLNFVNNFSEVSTELVDELENELAKGDTEEVKAIAGDIRQNLQKIYHHGGRASSIVKGMLEHSRSSSGKCQPTDLNALADEYLRLAYQGQRAKDKRFTCELLTNFEPALPQLEVVPAEIGRVLLNLYNNAFYAVEQRTKQAGAEYQPTVRVTTLRVEKGVQLRVADNGTGMPEAVQQKVFQPFFTTKPTGEGTGLGLSLSYDIITKGHGGTLSVASQAGESTTFVIELPLR